VVVGFVFGAPVVGGSDSYGYVSEAHLFATGRLRDELRLAGELVPAVDASALVPLAYNLGADGRSMVPVYAPGLPLVMAVFERVAGPRSVFWVQPLLAGLAVWSTFLLGGRVAGPLAGAIAAVLLAASPGFLFQLTPAPMSDLPAAAWWALALAMLLSDRRWAAPVAASAAALAILTRPNLVPVVMVPWLVLAWSALAEHRAVDRHAGELGARPRRRELLIFSAGVVIASLVVATLNTRWYGSPLASGYDVRGLFALEHALPNLARYPALLSVMQTPVVWLAALAPWLAWRRRQSFLLTITAAGFVLAVFACYLFYPGFDAWVTLRFLVPALPALFVSLAVVLVLGSERVPPLWRSIALAAVVGVIAVRGFDYARDRSAFDTAGELRFRVIGEAIAQRLPENAVVLAMQHSGSVRYYAGREIVRWDQVPPDRLDRLMKRLRRLGRPAYLVLDPWEVPEFQKLFAHRSPLGSLDWPPAIELERVEVRVWELGDRARRRRPPPSPPQPGMNQRARTTEVLPWPY
jgi:hypothetical protein